MSDIKSGNKLIMGIDEAGRGPLAGPVTAACVVLPDNFDKGAVCDSKKLTKKQRERLYPLIVESSLAYAVVSVGSKRIDKLNILQATRLAMRLACQRVVISLGKKELLESSSPLVLIDGNSLIETSLNQQCIVKGDSLVPEISAASILAKVTRDRLMCHLDSYFPGYGLANHAGYPTKSHKQAITELGPTRIHRRFFRGVSEHL